MFIQIILGLLLASNSLQGMQQPLTDREESLIKTGQLLQAAIDRESGSVARLLVTDSKAPAYINYQDRYGDSILLHAARAASISTTPLECQSSFTVLSYLLEAKANPNAANNTKQTPLWVLASRVRYAHSHKVLPNLLAAMCLLLEHGAKKDTQDKYGKTAFGSVSDDIRFNEVRVVLKF